MTIEQAMKSDDVSYYDFYNFLMENDLGFWDEVNSTEIIHDYINQMMRDEISVSHILAAMEQEGYESSEWKMWLGNSMTTPKPIRSKEDLVDALSLTKKDLMLQFDPQHSPNCHLKYDFKEER